MIKVSSFFIWFRFAWAYELSWASYFVLLTTFILLLLLFSFIFLIFANLNNYKSYILLVFSHSSYEILVVLLHFFYWINWGTCYDSLWLTRQLCAVAICCGLDLTVEPLALSLKYKDQLVCTEQPRDRLLVCTQLKLASAQDHYVI